jgi:hypothetical protein
MPRKSRTASGTSWANDLIWLENLWDEPTPATPRARSGPESLQGAWMASSGRRQGELLIRGDRLTVHFSDGDIYMGRFTLGDGTMDVTIEEGPAHHKGLLALCLWEVDGDTLRWVTASPGQKDRPADFIEADPRHLLLVLTREHLPKKG